MIQYHTTRPVVASERATEYELGEYRVFEFSDGYYANGPFGFLRQYLGGETLEQVISDLKSVIN